MPPRSAASDLVRLLDRSALPIYAVDAERKIVFVNQACVAWLGQPRDDLLGVQCRYHSETDDQVRMSIAGLLCPPPQVFHGQGAKQPIAVSVDEQDRMAEFTPLVAEDGSIVGALTIVSAETPLSVAAGQSSESSGFDTEALHLRLRRFRQSQRDRHQVDRLLGDSPAITRVRAQVAAVAANSASVLIVGPPGSGRQHVARTIHFAHPEGVMASLVPLACPLLSAELLQVTIRSLARSQPVHRASIATLLLNDVDQLPLEAQTELLGFMRLTELPFRVLATARQPLLELRGSEPFHEELAWRLSTFIIELPPLTERMQDLPLLAQMFLEEFNAGGDKQLAGFTPEAFERLVGYTWPRQIDELAEIVRQAHASAAGPWVSVTDLPKRLFLAAEAARHPRRVEETIVLEDFLAEIERELIQRAVAQAKGNKTLAAKLLGMTRPRLYRRLVQLGLEPDDDPPQFE